MSDETEPPPQEIPPPEAAAADVMAEAPADIPPGEPDGLLLEPAGEAAPTDPVLEGAEDKQLDKVEGQAGEGGEAPPEAETKQGDANPEGDAEVKPEGEAEAKPKGEAEAKPEGEAEAKPEGEAEAKPEGEAEAKPEGEAEAKPEGEAEAKSEAETKPEGEAPETEGPDGEKTAEGVDEEEDDQNKELFQDEEDEAAPKAPLDPIAALIAAGQASQGVEFDAELEEEAEHDIPEEQSGQQVEQQYEMQEEEEREDVRAIDRPMYYELFKVYERKANEERMKNHYLQKRMTDYYKRRRMLHVLRESMYESDTQVKYERKLDALDQLIDISTRESERIHAEVADMRKQRNEKKAELTQFFNKMQKRELVIGQDLLNTKGPKYNVEKVVEQYLKHQRSLLALVIKMRLSHIKIRNRVQEKQAELRALDNLGPNLHLVDYEQLKNEVRNNSDKLEERDGELLKIRGQCKNSMQILAHFREKLGAYDADIDTFNDHLEEITREHDDVREQLLYLRQERDNFRTCTNKLRVDSGLLTKPVLLRDMEDTLDEISTATEKLKNTKDQYNTFSEQVAAVRKHIENYREKKNRPSLTMIDKKAGVISSPSKSSLSSQQPVLRKRSSNR